MRALPDTDSSVLPPRANDHRNPSPTAPHHSPTGRIHLSLRGEPSDAVWGRTPRNPQPGLDAGTRVLSLACASAAATALAGLLVFLPLRQAFGEPGPADHCLYTDGGREAPL